MENPNQYIMPACLPACQKLWDKNIETFMTSNYNDDHLYVLFTNLSNENIGIFEQLHKQDSRFIIDKFRNMMGIAVKGIDGQAMLELQSLTEYFKMQDTIRFKTTTEFLEDYKHTDGELYTTREGKIGYKINPNLANETLVSALDKSHKSGLYVPEEGRIYDSELYLKWHKKYLKQIEQENKDQLDYLLSKKENIRKSISYIRDIFLSAESEYLVELLKDEEMKDLFLKYNKYPVLKLFELAEKLIEKIEYGEVSYEEMEINELELIVLLAAIQDKVLNKDLIKFLSSEDCDNERTHSM